MSTLGKPDILDKVVDTVVSLAPSEYFSQQCVLSRPVSILHSRNTKNILTIWSDFSMSEEAAFLGPRGKFLKPKLAFLSDFVHLQARRRDIHMHCRTTGRKDR